MEHLCNALRALFAEQDGDEILYKLGYLKKANSYSAETIHMDTSMQESEIMRLLKKANIYNTLDQQMIVSQVILSEWMEKKRDCGELAFFSQSVFNMLLHFGLKTIDLKGNEPVCRYRRLLRWHLVTGYLGEDLITTAFLASSDCQNNSERLFFDWPAFIGHDNKELNAILKRPIADLHMHLKGSSFNFDLSWLSVMNNVYMQKDKFDQISEKRKNSDWDSELYEKLYRASCIRLFLAGRTGIIPDDTSLTSAHLNILLSDDFFTPDDEGKKRLKEFEGAPITIREVIGKIKECSQGQDPIYDELDYIPIIRYGKETVYRVLASERKLMYSVFRYILGKKDDSELIASLFYAYLSYKLAFRKAIVQLNSTVGFRNFSEYEDLKDVFLEKPYKGILYKVAIENFLIGGRNRYLEARITPKNTYEDLADSVREIKDCVDAKYKRKFNLILHFIKQRDARVDKKYRHKSLRDEIRKQAYAIYKFRNNEESWKVDPLAGFVVGIDAANSEIYCRPEVYSQAFRFLRGHRIQKESYNRPNDLNVTFHVGEDFFDVVDGLRAVEEALLFLGLRNGDRLGHCLVLGTDVREYYSRRYHTICATKQVILDNMAWLHHKCKRLLGYTPLCYYLESTFRRFFIDVYGAEDKANGKFNYEEVFDGERDLRSYDIQDYYQSWFLRGNSPTFGTDEDLEPSSDMEREWLNVSVNHHIGVEQARHNKKALDLHELYHSDRIVTNGADAVTFTIRKEYREEFYSLIEMVQEHLLCKIERKRIAIECNPSSNYRIGEMTRYDEHPILKFYNHGLSTPYKSHSIAVSINTDDQGVFATSLEREYSLMALAIERFQPEGTENSPRQILEWLDRIRVMSVEQQFE